MRPASIVRFERVYGAYIVIGLIQLALSWGAANALLQTQLAQAPNLPPSFGSTVLLAAYAVGVLIQLLLLYFIARRASDVARWILVIFFVLAVLGIVRGMLGGTLLAGLPGILSIVGFILYAVSVVLLFQPDARLWFQERRIRS